MSVETNKEGYMSHQFSVKNRESMEISGVTDVISFDEQSVVLNTICGEMAVEGASLHIHVLSMEQGIVTMEGHIDSVTYYEQETAEKNAKRGFFRKIFR